MIHRRKLVMATALAGAVPLAAKAQKSIKVRWDSYAPEVLESDSLAMKWNHEFLVAVRVIAPPPTVASRNLAILHTAMYNAWAAYDDRALDTQLGAALRRPASERTKANRERAISFAAYLAAVDQFPSQAAQFEAFMRKLGYDVARLGNDSTRPEGVALRSVQALLSFRHHDGSNQLGDLNPKGLYTDASGYKLYQPGPHGKVDPVQWTPLTTGNGLGGFHDIHAHLQRIGAKPRQRVTAELGGFAVQRYVTPHWGNVLPFSIERSVDAMAAPPLPFAESDLKPAENEDNENYADLDALDDDQYPSRFRQQVRQVLRYSSRLTNREKAIAEYWADGPLSEAPPGHWNVLAHYLARLNSHDMDQDIKMFFVLNNAVMDAGIVSWHSKRVYHYVRPLPAVKHLFGDTDIRGWSGPVGGVRAIKGADWWPYQEKYFVTPAFPEHTSGHSTFSFAAATALRLFRGSDEFGAFAVVRRGSSSIDIGRMPTEDVTLRWATLTDAARQASLSRRYAGLHFAHGDLEGRKLGMKVGETAFRTALACIEGRGIPKPAKYTNLYATSAS